MAEFLDLYENLDPRAERHFRERIDPLEYYTDLEFYQRFRFTKPVFRQIADLVRPEIRKYTERSHALSTEAEVAIALKYYASGAFQMVVGDCINVSQPTVFRVLDQFGKALDTHFDQFIYFPTDLAVLRDTKQNFALKAGFPNVIGCIDGCHIPIVAPLENENEYINRKNWHSINCQFVCDHQGLFTNIVVQWPGRCHDSFILRNSNLWNFMENHADMGFVLGDSGYPLRKWLMTPVRAPSSNSERNYNQSHSRTRAIIENAFGYLKRRFPVCSIPNRRRDLSNTLRDIRVCAILHNIAVKNRMPDLDEPEGEGGQGEQLVQPNTENENAGNESDNVAFRTRQRLIDRIFT